MYRSCVILVILFFVNSSKGFGNQHFSLSVNKFIFPIKILPQSPVQSLEALARQAKIKFTTTKDSSIYEYFFNMATAEDELFR